MNNVQRQAQKDAAEYARAFMSYGEGAGNRRKLIYGTVDYKMQTIPGYEQAFRAAHGQQNMARFAKDAERIHRRKTLNRAVTRNTKAVMSGRIQDVDTALLVLGVGAYFAHRYEFDKMLVEKGKKQYKKIRNRFRKDGVQDVSSL